MVVQVGCAQNIPVNVLLRIRIEECMVIYNMNLYFSKILRALRMY